MLLSFSSPLLSAAAGCRSLEAEEEKEVVVVRVGLGVGLGVGVGVVYGRHCSRSRSRSRRVAYGSKKVGRKDCGGLANASRGHHPPPRDSGRRRFLIYRNGEVCDGSFLFCFLF